MCLKLLHIMQNKLKILLILGFAQLFIFVIVSNHFSSPTTNIFGQNAFKLGNKTFSIEETEGLLFSTDEYYNRFFESPEASFFIIDYESSEVDQLIVSGTVIRGHTYQGFNDIIEEFTTDTTLTIIEVDQSDHHLDILFSVKEDSSLNLFTRIFQAYPHYLQLFGTWEGQPNIKPEKVQKALNSVKLLE